MQDNYQIPAGAQPTQNKYGFLKHHIKTLAKPGLRYPVREVLRTMEYCLNTSMLLWFELDLSNQ